MIDSVKCDAEVEEEDSRCTSLVQISLTSTWRQIREGGTALSIGTPGSTKAATGGCQVEVRLLIRALRV